MRILAINPGSTSTKIAVYQEEEEIFRAVLEHSASDLAPFSTISSQYPMRRQAIYQILEENQLLAQGFAAVVGRGGMLPPLQAGAYQVNQAMLDYLLSVPPEREHASNLGALIAHDIAGSFQAPAYIYDCVAVDQFIDLARFSGFLGISRSSFCHTLNSRAMAFKLCQRIGKAYDQLNFLIAHLGGGISLSVHNQGRMIDIVSDDEGPFSPERCGRVPAKMLAAFCFHSGLSEKEIMQNIRGKGGFYALMRTTDAREIEELAQRGNEKARLCYEAMAYQIAKGLGELATTVNGRVDHIILTGGLAKSSYLTGMIIPRVSFIAPVEVMPGENELESLALGVLRVLRGQEGSHHFGT